VKHHVGRQIARLITFLSREKAQSKPDNTVMLSVISGSSFLALTKWSGGAEAALAGLVRLLH
jgi:hypothetical protein